MSKKKKQVKYLSASRMKTLEMCSWTYWCKYHLGLPDKTNDGALRGSICHLILELLLKPRHKKHYDLIVKSKAIKASKPVDKTVIKFLKANDIYNKENYDLCSKMIYVALDHDFFGGENVNLLFLTSGIFVRSFQLSFFRGTYLSKKLRTYSITFAPLIGL